MKNNNIQEKLDDFVKKNKNKFDCEEPQLEHEKRFMFKLNERFKKIISIIPHLIKVAIITIVIFIISFIIWDNFIDHPSDQKSLSQVSWKYRKLEYSYKYQIHKLEKKIIKTYIKDDKQTQKDLKIIMNNFDISYDYLARRLKKNPHDKFIVHSMVLFYQLKYEALKKIDEDYKKDIKYEKLTQK